MGKTLFTIKKGRYKPPRRIVQQRPKVQSNKRLYKRKAKHRKPIEEQ